MAHSFIPTFEGSMFRPYLLAVLMSFFAVTAQGEPIAITGGAVLTQGPAGDLARGTVVIDGGRIVAVGTDIEVPPGARIVDATNKIVTPGFINPLSANGMSRPSSYDEQPTAGDVPIADEIYRAFDPAHVDVKENPVDGATSGVLVPTIVRSAVKEGKLFAGNAAAVELSGAFDFLIKKNLGPVFSVSAAASVGGRQAAFPRLVRALDDARIGLSSGDRTAKAKPEHEVLRSVLNGEVPLLVEVDRAADILNVLDIAREQHIRIVLLGAAEGWLVASQIAQAKVPVIVSADENLPLDMDRLNSTYQNAARLATAGVTMALAGEGIIGPAPRTTRSPRYVAGRAVAYGLDPKTAIESITIRPAQIYGFAADTGSIEVGKRADVVVWSGDPLEVTSFVEHVFVKGVEPPPPRSALLRDKYRQRVNASSRSVAAPAR